MKPQEIDKIKALDSQGTNGTIASVLLDTNINQAHYADVLYYLLVKTLEERSYYERVTTKATNIFKGKGMMVELNMCLELEEK
jgi:hypothetical protein